ncbi:hypothetical protein [Massilia antarctica]|uniref:hypothetical protein n=1 Tax=Massilia antarctica TaxID=2765360 RepID=UPI0006BD9184|nr:hypothetical protein [Massilia sp. H27-R4]MCY0915226.1 hypothetical protein [Massilia sp. H27-R4]CUI05720.1 hypothetical protein BN2497_6217 [Janthinobacterium sp. CG23_2]CUU29506.1 hypothetical protein BN3177_6217 [Janthinobacterium sp. CG23_2]
MLVIIEGSDFSGKSTVSAALASKLRQHQVAVDVRPVMLVRGPIEKLVDHIQEHPSIPAFVRAAAFNLACVVDAFAFRKRRGLVTIQESCPLRVQTHNLLRGRTWCAHILGKALRHGTQPDIAVFLQCSFEERRRRWRASNSTDVRDEVRFMHEETLNRSLDHTLQTLALDHGFRLISSEHTAANALAEELFEEIISKRTQQ